jgi:hypothetical protein
VAKLRVVESDFSAFKAANEKFQQEFQVQSIRTQEYESENQTLKQQLSSANMLYQKAGVEFRAKE